MFCRCFHHQIHNDKRTRKTIRLSNVTWWKLGLNRLNDNPIDRSVKLPEMEIRLKQMQVRGTSGCNTYSTKISKLATNAIKFCTIVSTKGVYCAKILSKNILRP
jgi:heat shock protein HslJ